MQWRPKWTTKPKKDKINGKTAIINPLKSATKLLKEHVWSIIILLIMTLFAWHNTLFEPGLINYGDFAFPIILENYLKHPYSIWTDLWSYNNFAFFPRSLGYAPLMIVGLIPGMTSEIFERFFLMAIYAMAGVSMYIATNVLLSMEYLRKDGSNLDEKVKALIKVAAVVSMIIYMNNPYVINHIAHIYLRYSYALAPLILVGVIKSIHSERYFKWSILSGFLMAVAAGTQHWLLFGPMLVGLYFIFDVAIEHTKTRLIDDIKRMVVIGLVYLGCIAYWFLPAIYVIFTQGWLAPPYVLSIESVLGLQIKTNPYTVFTLMSFFWPKFTFIPDNSILRTIWVLSSVSLPIVAFIVILLRYKSRLIMFFFMMMVLFIILALGLIAIMPGLYIWLIFDAPYSGLYGWMLRDPNKWTQFIILCYAVLSAFFVMEMFRWSSTRKKGGQSSQLFAMVVLGGLLISAMFFAWPGLTGNFNGLMSPAVVPEEYYDATDYIAENADGIKVRWMPTYASKYTTWNNKWMGTLFDVLSSPVPTMSGDFSFYRQYFRLYAYDALLNNKTSHFGALMFPSNTGMVAFHNDTVEVRNYGEPKDPKVLSNLLAQDDLKEVWHEGMMYVLKGDGASPEVYIPDRSILAVGSIDLLTSLTAIKEYSPNSAVVFIQQIPTVPPPKAFDTLLFDSPKPENDALLYFTKANNLVVPADYTKHYDYHRQWSMTNTYTYAWATHLSTYNNIDKWDFDYLKGLVFTYADGVDMNMPIEVPTTEEYVISMRYFQNKNGGEVKVYLDGQQIIDVDTDDERNAFVWDSSDTLTIDSGIHTITLENVEGFNAVNVLTI
ncbi:MAG: hypothetical protein ACXQS2_00540 [Methermicoccaceae archaeon]